MAANWRNSPEGIARSLGQSTTTTNPASTNRRPTPGRGNYGSNSTTSTTSSSSSTNRSDSAGAQALTQQIASNFSTKNTTNSSKTGNSKIDSFVSAVKENISNSSNAPKTTVTEAMRNNTSTSNNQSSSATSEKTTNLSGGTILGSIIADKPTQTVTESIRGSSTSSKKESSTPKTAESTVIQNQVVDLGDTKKGSSMESVIIPAVSTPKQTETEKAVSESLSNVFESKQKEVQNYNPAEFVVGKTTSEAPKFTGEINYAHNNVVNDRALVSNQQIAQQIYRDDDLIGVHFFSSKAESEAFLKELYPEGNYDWRDRDVKWYDTQTGEYIGDLGQSAYPFAAVVPELSDQDVILFHNTGGSKGNSPSTGTGLSSWTDVPSAHTRHALRDEFDFSFSSKNLDYDEIKTQLERQGINETWYDGKVGQNSTKTNISVGDARSGKVSSSDYQNAFGSSSLADIEGYEIHFLPTKQTQSIISGDYSDYSKWLNPNYDWSKNHDTHITNPTAATQDNTILNNPFELVGTMVGVGGVVKMAGVGSKIAQETWVSTGGKVMSGLNIVDTPARSVIGGGATTAGKAAKQGAEYASNQLKLTEVGALGLGGLGIFAGKELDTPSTIYEIIPQNIVKSEIESSSRISGLNEVTPHYYESELEPTSTTFQNPFDGVYVGSVMEIERVKEKEKTKTKKEKEFSYADIPTFTEEEKRKYAREAYEKQRQQEIEYEKQKAREEAERQKQKEKELTIEKESEFVFIGEQEKPVVSEIVSDGITKTKEKNRYSDVVKERYTEKSGLVFDYPIREKYNIGLKNSGLIKEKYAPIYEDVFENVNNTNTNTNPFVFDFGFDQQQEDRRRRESSESDKHRAGKYRMNHYRLFHNIATAEEMGLGLREVNPNKSRKIGFENVEWFESGGTRSTRKNTTLFTDSWDKSSFFEPVTRKRRKTTTKKNRKRRK